MSDTSKTLEAIFGPDGVHRRQCENCARWNPPNPGSSFGRCKKIKEHLFFVDSLECLLRNVAHVDTMAYFCCSEWEKQG